MAAPISSPSSRPIQTPKPQASDNSKRAAGSGPGVVETSNLTQTNKVQTQDTKSSKGEKTQKKEKAPEKKKTKKRESESADTGGEDRRILAEA